MSKIELATMQKQATRLVSRDKTKLTVDIQQSLDTVLAFKTKLHKIAKEATLDVSEIQKGIQAAITIHDAEEQLVKALNKQGDS